MTSKTKHPVQTFRDKAIGVSIWERNGSNGPFYEFTVSRSFKKNNDDAGYTSSFRADNIEALRTVLAEAQAWLRGSQGQLAV